MLGNAYQWLVSFLVNSDDFNQRKHIDISVFY